LKTLHCIGEGVIFSLEVKDADIAFEVAKSKLLNIVLEVCSEDWGQRHFCVCFVVPFVYP